MEALITATLLAIRSIFAPGMMGIFIKSVLLTIGVLFAFTALVSGFSLWLMPHIHNETLALFVPVLGVVGSHILAWFLFPGIMPVIVNFFDNRIINLIERHEYPASAGVSTQPFWPAFWRDARFSLKAVALNILVLPLYLVPVLNIVLFYWLNGYLLGREFFLDVARRHRAVADAEALRNRHSGVILLGGMLLSFLATVPLANLIAPFWGIALMTHLYHRLAMPEMQVLPPI